MTFHDFLESDIADKYVYTARSTILFNWFQNEITESDVVYQRRRDKIIRTKNGRVPCFEAAMGNGGNNVPIVLDRGRIRKLTPRECFRLQGFSDFESNLSNGRQYVQSGNTITVNVLETIFAEVLL